MALVQTPAVLLRAFDYGETSRILRFFTRDLGIVGVMGRGVRRSGGRGGGGPQTFAEGALTLDVKPTRELQNLREFTPTRPRRALAADVLRFACASVLAEVVLRHGGEAASPEVFTRVSEALDAVEAAAADRVPRAFLTGAWGTVAALGYQPELQACVRCGRAIGTEEAPAEASFARFDFESGGLLCASCGASAQGPRVGPGARAQLRGLLEGEGGAQDVDRVRAHVRLLADFVTWHLSGGRPLQSIDFLAGLLPVDEPG